MEKEYYKSVIALSNSIFELVKKSVLECLVKLGATDKEHGIVFDWEYESAPSICSMQFGDDVADSYITKIWYDKGLIKVNLHAYYVGDDRENIDLADECNVDYEDILDYLSDYLASDLDEIEQ